MILYHYTDAGGYNGISNTNVLMPSRDSVVDAAHGPGHYFTDLLPNNCDRVIAKYCWGNKIMTVRVGYYLKCDVPEGFYTWCKPHVYLIPEGKVKNFNLLFKGQKPYCKLKPCTSCYLDPSI